MAKATIKKTVKKGKLDHAELRAILTSILNPSSVPSPAIISALSRVSGKSQAEIKALSESISEQLGEDGNELFIPAIPEFG